MQLLAQQLVSREFAPQTRHAFSRDFNIRLGLKKGRTRYTWLVTCGRIPKRESLARKA